MDSRPPLENYHNFKTIYKRDYLENTTPEDYHPNIVERGSNGFKDYPKENTIKTYEKLESATIQQQKDAANADSLDAAKSQFLKSGVEHWKSNYKHQVDVPLQIRQDLNGIPGVNPNATHQSNTGGNTLQGEQLKSSTMRSSSANNRPANLFRPAQPEWSKNTFAHFNKAPVGVTDYKFNYG